jgi:hypothetical protein
VRESHRFVFIAGLHRSGTSLLFQCLREHPEMSAFRGTNVPEDEGQHLQTVYPPALAFGGPGKFGFDPRSRLTESSELISEDSRRRLLEEWGRHWDMGKPVLVEKSPPNLVRSRFLQALFPESCFVVLTRHPVPVAYATQKWSHTSLRSLIEHWLVCHEIFEEDAAHLGRVLRLRYEDFIASPQVTLDAVFAFAGVSELVRDWPVRSDGNDGYFARWRDFLRSDVEDDRRRSETIRQRYADRLARFGYSLDV